MEEILDLVLNLAMEILTDGTNTLSSKIHQRIKSVSKEKQVQTMEFQALERTLWTPL